MILVIKISDSQFVKQTHQYFFRMSNLSHSYPEADLLTLHEEQIYLEEWMQSSRLLFYSVICISLFTLPVLLLSLCYISVKPTHNVHFLPYLYSILIANFVLLATLFTSVITKNTDMVYGEYFGRRTIEILFQTLSLDSLFANSLHFL